MKCKILLLLGIAATCLWAKSSCMECHSSLGGKLGAPATLYKNDVHAASGPGCADCHGGDPNQDDPSQAMNRAHGFRGKISRTQVPGFCARCHSDANFMRKFNPDERVDQLAQYKTSVHGKRLAAGDTAVAVCVDCHGVHNIRNVKDPLSPVYPLRIPGTCAKCHADPKHMAPYKLGTNQYANYTASVHWEALSKRGDLSAPTCATCHGNHGASPPQVSSVAAVCGTCHVLMENLYKKSPHGPAFAAMGLGGCVVCHGNHRIVHPTTKFLIGANSVCSQCHDADSAGGKAAAEMGGLMTELRQRLDDSDQILLRAKQSGMEVSEAFMRERAGREKLIKATVAVHAFRVQAVKAPVTEGLAIAAETHAAGEAVLKEREVRRIGLGLALITILMVLAGLWLAIRSLEQKAKGDPGSPAG